MTAIPSRALATVGKLSRAAIFAGAAACYTSTPDAKQPPPPPPPPNDVAPPIDTNEAPPPDTHTFAQPPAAGTGRIRGVVRQSGNPLGNVTVMLSGLGPPHANASATTDKTGKFVFDGLAAGDYDLVPKVFTGGRFGPPRRRVHLADGADELLDLDVPEPPPPDTGPCCKPYGAPPARRRVV